MEYIEEIGWQLDITPPSYYRGQLLYRSDSIVHEIFTDFIEFKTFCNPLPHELDDVRARIENPDQKPC